MAGGLRDGASLLNVFPPKSESVALLLIAFVDDDEDRLKTSRCLAEDAARVCSFTFSFWPTSLMRDEREEVESRERGRGFDISEFSRLMFSISLAFFEEADAVSNGRSTTTAVGMMCLAE